jgi:hypothetical protein
LADEIEKLQDPEIGDLVLRDRLPKQRRLITDEMRARVRAGVVAELGVFMGLPSHLQQEYFIDLHAAGARPA